IIRNTPRPTLLPYTTLFRSEVGERAGGHLHRLTEGVLDLGPRPFAVAAARVQDAVDLGLRERHRLGPGADEARHAGRVLDHRPRDRKSTRLNSSHSQISYAV